MRRAEKQTHSAAWRTRSANDELKEGWNSRLGWSIVLAVILHALLFVSWPSWVRSDPELEPSELEPTPLELISLAERLGGLSGMGAAPVPVSEIPDSLSEDPEETEGSNMTESELASLSGSLRERLLRGGVVPTVVAREPDVGAEPEDEDPRPEGQDSTTIQGRASSTAELTDLPEPDALDLDRLSAIRPELALLAPSSWVLIRNPTEVERFMERIYLRGDLQRSETGTVSVALWIDERGSVEWAEINRSSGHTNMDEAALELFSDVVAFRPARDEGVPVSRSVIFSVRFPW